MQPITIPIGPGRGKPKPLDEALQSLIGEMRAHVRDLRDSDQAEQAEILERYLAALDVIYWQLPDGSIVGTGLQANVLRLAKKHNLEVP